MSATGGGTFLRGQRHVLELHVAPDGLDLVSPRRRLHVRDRVQTRGQRCVRGDGRPVPRRHCDHLSQTGDTQVSCTVDCPVDCQLSSWSSWSDLQCQCGKAGLGRNLTRSRHIVVSASATGRPCPLSLTQTKPCPSQPCYQWRPSAWSECQLQVCLYNLNVISNYSIKGCKHERNQLSRKKQQ